MSEMSEHQRRVIRTLKGIVTNDFPAGFDTKIPIINDKNIEVGLLKPLDYHLANNQEIVNSLAAWRRRFNRFFFTRFEVTSERTKNWLNDVIIKDDTRILFLVTDETKKLTGHLGACNINRDSAELDNFIRGERGGDPKLMLLSGLSLIGWIFGVLNIKKINARVLANNFRTLSVYEAAGCFERSGLPEFVKGIDSNESVGGLTARNGQPPPEGNKFVVMTLNLQKFLSRYPWMATSGERR
jgi:RimJ/RimL family protein N-acetyltransferase